MPSPRAPCNFLQDTRPAPGHRDSTTGSKQVQFRNHRRSAIMAAGLTLIACRAAGASSPALLAAATGFHAKPCVAGTPAGFRCGVVDVPEDWNAIGGRRLSLNVMIAPARRPIEGAPPLVFLAGGPGSPATEYAPAYADPANPYRAHQDVVLFDLRGTGG